MAMRNALAISFVALSIPLATASPTDDVAKNHESGTGYTLQRKISLGGEGRWDYVLVDSDANRIYVPRSTRVSVIDLTTDKVIGEIPDTPGVHGVALVSELGLGFASNGKDASVTVFDLKSLKSVEKVKVGENPDAIVYDAASRQVFAFNGRGKSATAIAIEPVDGKPRATKTVDLGGKPEFAVADGQGHVYVNIEDTSEIVALDSKKVSILNRWSIAPGESASGLAMDLKTRRLFAVCENQKMVVLDADSGKVLATPSIGKGPDACAFDPATGFAFSSNGEGSLTIVHEKSATEFEVVETVPTQKGARTMALDAKTHTLYLPTIEPDKAFVLLVVAPGSHAKQ